MVITVHWNTSSSVENALLNLLQEEPLGKSLISKLDQQKNKNEKKDSLSLNQIIESESFKRKGLRRIPTSTPSTTRGEIKTNDT